MKRIDILGAGPAGLAAAHFAKKNNIPFQLYESQSKIGGNCKTFEFNGCKYDTGAHRFHNKNNIATVLDEMIASKLEEAQESGMYSSKDLADLLQMAHKMRMDEIKAQADLEKAQSSNIKNQTNVQINEAVPFGQGNYGKLMEKLLKDGTE